LTRVEDGKNGELSFRTLIDEMTPSELCMSWVDSKLQHESQGSYEAKNVRTVRVLAYLYERDTPFSIESSSLSRMVRIDFFGFEMSLKNTPW